MSSFSNFLKLFTCASIACGITVLPINYRVTEEENKPLKILEETLTSKEENPKILIGNTVNGHSLSLINTKSLLEKVKKSGEKVTFKEVGMKWGDKALTEYDELFSPCQRGNYYLIRGNSRYQYTLEDGTSIARTPRCPEMNQSKYQKLKHVSMQWKTTHRSGSITPSQIALGSCNFTKHNESSLKIICHESFRRGKGTGNIAWGVLTFDKEN